METSTIIHELSLIPIGTIVAWLVVLAGIVTTIVTFTIKLYKAFEKTHEIREESIEFKKMIQSHDEQLKSISDKLSHIQEQLNKQDESDLKSLRYAIVRAGEEYVSKGQITIRQLRALEEMYEEYQERHGNGYVATLMLKVRNLPVIGKLDENDDDIEE